MLATYRYNNEAIETVYTYDEWLKEYKRRETKQRIRQRTEHFYCMKQRVCGVIMAAIGIVTPFVFDGDVTISLFALPMGIFLLLTRKKVMTFQNTKKEAENLIKKKYCKAIFITAHTKLPTTV